MTKKIGADRFLQLGSSLSFWSICPGECPPNVLRIWLVSSRFLPACPPGLGPSVVSRSSKCLKVSPTPGFSSVLEQISSVLCPGLRPRTLGSICPFWSRECPPNVLRIWLVSSRFLQRPPGFSSVLQLSQVSSVQA